MRGFFRYLLFSLLILPAVQPLLAQNNSQEALPSDLVFKRPVRLVIVDVVVTDSKGKPVRGLTVGDFSVSEDGKPQQILSYMTADRIGAMEVALPLAPEPQMTATR